MAYTDLGYNFLLGVDDPIDDADGINSRNADEIFEDHSVEFNFTTMDSFQPDQDMQSSNFITGLEGWKIYGDGFAEFAGITLTGGLIHYNKASFTDDTVSGYYISPSGIYFGDVGDATKLKFTIATGVLDLVGTISGRDTADVATAINGDANLVTEVINSSLNTQSEEILGNYDFGASGSLEMSTDPNNGIWLSPTGILGKKAGVPTFTITTSGDATFAGTLAALGGTFGTITAGSLTVNTLVGGRLAVTIGGAINASGIFINDVINTNLDTQTKAILGEFVFTGVGALKMATDASNGLWLSPTGILGKKGGATTFAVDTGGNATFGGSLVAADGTFGTITAGDLTGVTITGATVQTAVTYPKMILNTNNLTGYDAGPFKRMQLDRDSLEFYDTAALRTMSLESDSITYYKPSTQDLLANITFLDSGSPNLTLNAPEGSAQGFHFGVRTPTLLYNIARLYFPAGGTAVFDLTLQAASRIQSHWFAAGASGYINFGTTYGASGYGLRMNSSVLEYYDSGSGTWIAFNSIGSGGEANTTSNAGGTYGLALAKSGVNLPFKGLSAGSGITISPGATDLTIGLTSGTTLNMMYYDGFNWTSTSTVYIGGISGANISWNAGFSNLVTSSALYVTGQIRSNTASVVLNGVTYTRTLMSSVVAGGTGYILHSAV